MKPSYKDERLMKAGWKLLLKTRQRSYLESPYDGFVYSQTYATEYEYQLAARKRLALKQNNWVTKG
jgi:hypothetical protein